MAKCAFPFRVSGIQRRARQVIATSLVLFGAQATAGEQDWQLQREEKNIRVYTREVSDSPYLAVKATAVIRAPVAHVSTFLGDGEGCMEWRAMCKSSRVLEQVSTHERYVHMVLDLPWPASDRDLVLHSRTTIDTQARTATVDLNSASSRAPLQDLVRAETRGQFIIRAVEEHATEFTYIMQTDLGGNLPAGAVNGRVAKTAFDDLQRLRRLAEG